MSDEPQHGAKDLNRTFQFSLRTLMGLTAAVALFCGMWTWRGELGVLEFFFGAAPDTSRRWSTCATTTATATICPANRSPESR